MGSRLSRVSLVVVLCSLVIGVPVAKVHAQAQDDGLLSAATRTTTAASASPTRSGFSAFSSSVAAARSVKTPVTSTTPAVLDISDAIMIIRFLFEDGFEIAAPFPECGDDPLVIAGRPRDLVDTPFFVYLRGDPDDETNAGDSVWAWSFSLRAESDTVEVEIPHVRTDGTRAAERRLDPSGIRSTGYAWTEEIDGGEAMAATLTSLVMPIGLDPVDTSLVLQGALRVRVPAVGT